MMPEQLAEIEARDQRARVINDIGSPIPCVQDRRDLIAEVKRLQRKHDRRCLSLTESENNVYCDCRVLAMIDGGAAVTRRMTAEVRRLRTLVEDLADRGLRADLNPTIDGSSDVYAQMTHYLRRLDATVRERARAALAPVADPDPHTTSDEETSNG
jgi:hypothetical protein